MRDGESINDRVQTCVYFNRETLDRLKRMALLTRSSMSQIVREATRDKLEELDKMKKEMLNAKRS